MRRAASSSLNAIVSPAAREPAPAVTRVRRFTVANVDSIGLSRPNMFPVRGGAIEVGSQPGNIGDQGLRGFRIRCLIVLREPVDCLLAGGSSFRIHHLVQGRLRLGLKPGGACIEDVRNAVHPAPLLSRLWPDLADRRPEPKPPVANGHGWRPHAPCLEIPQHRQPALGTLARAVLNREHE